MAVIATGQISIVDVTDAKRLSCYINSNQPRIQINDVNASSYTPNWASSNLVLSPIIYADNTQLDVATAPGLVVAWTRKPGGGSEAALETGESKSTAGVLTVSQNKLTAIGSGQLTYILTVTYTDPDSGVVATVVATIDFSLVKTGTNGADAKTCWISGDQVLKYSAGASAPTPEYVTLLANVSGVSVDHWEYKTAADTWATYPTGNGNLSANSNSWIIRYDHPQWTGLWSGATMTVRVITTDATVGDSTSVYKVSDGATGATGAQGTAGSNGTNGVDGITVIMSNPAHALPKTTPGNVVTYTNSGTDIRLFEGATELAYDAAWTTANGGWKVVATGSGITPSSPSDQGLFARYGDHSAMTGTTGSISYLITGKRANGTAISLTVIQTFSVSLQGTAGTNGANGTNGTNAILMSLYAPNGSVFVNQTGSLRIQAQAYDGSTAIALASATWTWEKYVNSAWAALATGVQYVDVLGTAVSGTLAIRLTMVYNSKTYTDILVLTDKTDNYQAAIESTGGDIFKNTVGTSFLICRLFQNGAEVDALKSGHKGFLTADPSSGMVTGDFYYKYAVGSPKVRLMRYSGTAWVDVTADATYKHARVYTWSRRDKDGNALGVFSATDLATADPGKAVGKVVFINGDNVDIKTTFSCEVT